MRYRSSERTQPTSGNSDNATTDVEDRTKYAKEAPLTPAQQRATQSDIVETLRQRFTGGRARTTGRWCVCCRTYLWLLPP